MKAFSKFLALVFAVGLVTYGCKPESTVNPKKDGSPELGLAGEDPHDRPTPQCMASVYAPLADAAGNIQGGDPFDAGVGPYGTVEIVNDPVNSGVLVSMGYYWLLASGKVWVGQCADVPVNTDGTVNWESFGWGSGVNPISQYFQWTVPTTSINLDGNLCACFVVCLEGVQADIFGNAYNNTILWAKGDRTVGTNAWGMTACPVPCPFINDEECHDLDPSNGRTCDDITLVSSTAGVPGAAPFTFNLFDATGAIVGTITNSTGTATFTVCPTSSSSSVTYTATVNDSRSIYVDTLDVTVSMTPSCTPPCVVPAPTSVSAIGAEYNCGTTNQGERKVNVCHLPPGNPANRQMICIAVSALPAHIIDFKPADNRCMGHSPGCHIGPCDPCGPNSSDDAIARAAAYRLQYGCRGN